MALHIVPTPIAEHSIHTLPEYVIDKLKKINVWYVEELKTARRLLRLIDKSYDIDNATFYVLNENEKSSLTHANEVLHQVEHVGLMSEAGCPAIADPGAELVAIAHQLNIEVIPYVGPSSILMALMASGFNGQCFKFQGYLPIKNPERSKAIQALENDSLKNNCTQIFIETPYRNNNLFEEILKALNSNTKISVALDITGQNEFIKTKTVADWKKAIPTLAKLPTVFLISA